MLILESYLMFFNPDDIEQEAMALHLLSFAIDILFNKYSPFRDPTNFMVTVKVIFLLTITFIQCTNIAYRFIYGL